MKRLILVRHAKSSWSDNGLADRARPLNVRGTAAADRIGRWLADTNRQPDQVFLSPAIRCQQTWDGISPHLADAPVPVALDRLYLAEAPQLLDVLQTASGDVVLLLGHMPGLGVLAHDLRQDPPPHTAQFDKYPTGAATVLEFPINDWRDLRLGTGVLDIYATPDEM